MSVNEKMTAIADAIRSKTGGTDKLGLDAMATAVNEVYWGGYIDGDTEGYQYGYQDGTEEGLRIGYAEGMADGYAEGEQEGYVAGQKSMAVVATEKGNPAVLDYVHPAEHELAVTVSSRNLLDIERCRAASEWGGQPFGLAVEKEGDVVHVHGTMGSCSNYASLGVLDSTQEELQGKGYVVQFFDADTNALMTESEHKIRAYGLRAVGEDVIAMLITNSTTGLVVDYRFRVVVSEVAQTTYVPYIADFTGYQVLQAEGEGGTYIAEADGTVPGVKSVSPTSLLYAATPNGSITNSGVIVTAEYYLDAERKLEDVGVSLMNLGGSL